MPAGASAARTARCPAITRLIGGSRPIAGLSHTFCGVTRARVLSQLPGGVWRPSFLCDGLAGVWRRSATHPRVALEIVTVVLLVALGTVALAR